MLCEATRWDKTLSLSRLRVEGGDGIERYDNTTEQTRYLLISLRLEAHTAVTVIHKAVLRDSYGMTSSFFLIVLSTTQ